MTINLLNFDTDARIYRPLKIIAYYVFYTFFIVVNTQIEL
jgi:hypothetical protein